MRLYFFSLGYRIIRKMSIIVYSIWCFIVGRTYDLEDVSDFGNHQMAKLDSFPFGLFYTFSIPRGLQTSFFGHNFKSPLIAASFQSDKKALLRWLKFGLGGITFKTIMADSRVGNERPRLSEVIIAGNRSIINAMGLPGEGVGPFVDSIINEDVWQMDIPFGLSMGGTNKEEYINVFNAMNQNLSSKFPHLFYEVNISCPNTEDGKTLSENPDELLFVLSEMRKECRNPIIVKVSPDQDNNSLLEIVETIKPISGIGINAGNTSYMNRKDVGLKEHMFKPIGGGVSGLPLFLRMLNMIKLFKPFNIPIIATGGIDSGQKAMAALNEGATLIGMASALIVDPYCIPRINQYLASHK